MAFDSDVGRKTRFGPDWPGRRCLAKTRAGGKCQKAALKGKNRCRNHGGLSTGPKTPEGLTRMRRAKTSHGLYVGPGHPDYPTPGPRWKGWEKRKHQKEWRDSYRHLRKVERWRDR
ncbi:MAG: HGGxSTG domain-containing protein [Proteobacteria bacterium]|nr:HGGxSTG domain-containing protein [Pseudomonadota bacterium]